MSAKEQDSGYVEQGVGLGVSRTTLKDSPDSPSTPMTEQESEERWAQLFASPKSQSLLKKMAAEALEEDRAGRTQDLVIDEL